MKNWIRLPSQFYREDNPNPSEDSYYLVNWDNIVDILIEDWENEMDSIDWCIILRGVLPQITYRAYFPNQKEFHKMQSYLASLGLPARDYET